MATRLLADFPQLADLPEKDLKDLLSDEAFCDAVLYSSPAVKAVLDEQEKLSKENDEVARKNLALQNELVALRSSTASAYSTAHHMKDRWVEIDQKQAALYQRQRPSFLHLRLRHSVNDQDAKTEAIAAAFIEGRPPPPEVVAESADGLGLQPDGSQTLESFIKTFRAERKIYHKREFWCEKWTRGEVAWRED